MAGMLLPSSLVFLLLAVNVPTMIKYMACSFCAVRVVEKHPDIAERAALSWAPSRVKLIGWSGVVLALLITVLGLEADVRPYLLVVGWTVIGLGYWLITQRRPAR